MTSLTPENETGRQPAYTRVNRQIDAEHLDQERAEDVYGPAPLLVDTHEPHSVEMEGRREDVYLFRKSNRASRGAARII